MTISEPVSVRPDLGAACPVCRSPAMWQEGIPGWGEWRRCSQCTLEFAHPLRLGHDPRILFDDAYQGRVDTSGMNDFRRRVDQRKVIIGELDKPSLWFWTPAFQDVLGWLKGKVRAGGTILEVGCGLGFFLHALRKEGFEAIGLDVAETVVDINRRDGFRVWHGPIETMDPGWVEPDAVVSFFMLHHLEDPLGFLRTVRERAPRAPLAIAVYGPTNRGMAASLPPRTLIRWNTHSLQAALELTGYRVEAYNVPSTGIERTALQPARKLMASMMRIPQVYRIGKQVESVVLRRLPRPVKRDAYVVVAFAEPVLDRS